MKGGGNMSKRGFKLLSLAFVFVLAFSIGFNMKAVGGSGGELPLWCLDFKADPGDCCVDTLGRRGALYPVNPPSLDCICDGYPGWPTINGPCGCPMDCYESGEPE